MGDFATDSAPCILCNGTDFRVQYDFGAHKILRCQSCDMMHLHPQPTQEELADVYDDSYFSNEMFFDNVEEHLYGYTDYIAERANRQYQWNELASELRNRIRDTAGTEQPRLLEIGCGLGHFLDTAFDLGFEVTGTDFNASAIDFLKRKYRFDVHCCANPLDAVGDREFDFICAFDVIEHLRNPSQVFTKLAGCCSAQGYLAISTMDSTSLLSRMLGKRLEDFRRIREHLYFFNRNTITRFLDAAGFEVKEIRSVGHTFELGGLLRRLSMMAPFPFRILETLCFPRWIRKANFYLDPGTKMLVLAQPKSSG